MRLAYSLALMFTATLPGGGANTLTIEPSSVIGGESATATLKLDNIARANTSYAIQLSSTEYASAPSTVTVGQLETSGSFTIGTRPVTLPQIVTVSVAGASATVFIKPASLSELVSAGRTVRNEILARLGLDGRAPFGGVTVTLSATAADARVLAGITIPKSVTIKAGERSVSFPIAVASDATPGTVTLTATLGKVALKQDITIP